MKNRATALIGLACLLAAGCVQGEQTYTLNPDGSGKVAIVLVTPFSPTDLFFGAPGRPGGKPPSLAEQKRAFLEKVLNTSRAVDAWKDVSAEYTPEGLLKFQGTAYFKDLKNFKTDPGGQSPARLERQPDGSLRLVFAPESLRTDLNRPGPKADQPDPRKLNDQELDEYILTKRVQYQTAKPLFRGLLTDLKLTFTFRLPGEVSGVKGYRPEGKRAVSFALDGNKLLKLWDDLMKRDNAFFRKNLRAGGDADLFRGSEQSLKLLGLNWHEAVAVVARPDGPQFDYAKEVAAARAAYPAMRKRLGLGEEKKAPNFPQFKGPPERETPAK